MTKVNKFLSHRHVLHIEFTSKTDLFATGPPSYAKVRNPHSPRCMGENPTYNGLGLRRCTSL